MKELNLYQTEEDELCLVEAALAVGCQILADSAYDTPEAKVIDAIKAFQFSRLTERHFFLLHKSFQMLPISLRKTTKNDKIKYYISPSQGGPLLEFMAGGIFTNEETGDRHIRSGFLGYRAEYWDASLTLKQPAPHKLADTYNSLARVIRSSSTRIKPDKRVYWLGDYARAQLLKGVKLGLHERWSLPPS